MLEKVHEAKMRGLTSHRLFVVILFVALFVMATREITDPDFWWHLRTGQLIVDTGSVPHSDPYSYTVAGKPWIAHEWLSEVFIYFLYRLGSFPALILVFSALITLSFALVWARSEGRPYVAAFAILLAALATAPTWGVRPQILSLLLSSVYLFILERYEHKPESRSVWLLVPLMLLWVNLHSGYALGLVIIGIYLIGKAAQPLLLADAKRTAGGVGENKRAGWLRLALVFVLCLLVVPLNPNGAAMYTYPFETLTSPTMQAFIQEWFSPDFHLVEFQPFAWLLLATLGAIALAGKRIGLVQILLLVVFGYAALRSARNIPFFAVVAAPVLAEQLWAFLAQRGWTEAFESKAQISSAAHLLNWIVLGVVVGGALLRVSFVIADQSTAEAAKFPAAAVDYVVSQRWAEPIYNSYQWGGYLIWRQLPGEGVFIDGRADVYGDQFIEEFLNTYRAGPNWKAELEQYHVGLVLIEPNAPLANELSHDGSWSKVYADKLAVVFRKQ